MSVHTQSHDPLPFTDIVHSYLASESDLAATIQSITVPINNLYAAADDKTTPRLHTLWRTILQFSKAHPLSSKAQSSLVALLHGLQSSSDAASTPGSSDLWNRLAHFDASVHELWTECPSCGTGTAATTAEGKGWVNMNSFLARVTKEGIAPLERYAVLVADKALEERQVDDRAGSEEGKLDVLLAAAGVWMVVMGEELWGRLGGEGDGAISRDRWELWKRRFVFMSRREGLDISSRELAAEAEAVMQRAA